jgi:hypothetical protein
MPGFIQQLAMTKFTTLAKPKLLMLRTHGAPTAGWTVMLLGWFWLGHQGLQLGWLYASGVTPLVLWWACRISAKQYARTHAIASSWVICCGLGAACLLAFTGLSPLANYDYAALNTAAVLWGLFLGLTEAHSQSLSNQCAQSMCYPLVAAVCVAGMWFIPGAWSGIGVALVVFARVGLLESHDRSCDTQGVSLAHSRWSEQLAPMAMGLMMATVWQGHAWCAGTGWSSEDSLLMHLLLMAGLPATAQWLINRTSNLRHMLHVNTWRMWSLALLVCGSILLASDAAYWFAGMLLQALAWAVHCAQRITRSDAVREHWLYAVSVAGLGPAALLWVGLEIQQQGPVVLQITQLFIAMLSACALLRLLAVKPGLSKRAQLKV